MKKLVYLFLVNITFFNPASTFAEDRAVNIKIWGIGGANAGFMQKVRKVIGQAFIANTADTVYVYSPRVEVRHYDGGLSVCIEASFSSPTSKSFNTFVQQLRSLGPPSPDTYTSYEVELTASCKPIEPVQPSTCGGIQGKPCLDAQQYCDFDARQCKTADAQGTCKAKPTVCPDISQPVCGCNGETYPNACNAARAGVSIDRLGECKRE